MNVTNLLIRMPRSLIGAHEQPSLSLVASKTHQLFVFVSERGHNTCPAKNVNALLPSLAHKDRRDKILSQLGALVVTPCRNETVTISAQEYKCPIKVYGKIGYENGCYYWYYTSEFVFEFLEAGIFLPQFDSAGINSPDNVD